MDTTAAAAAMIQFDGHDGLVVDDIEFLGQLTRKAHDLSPRV